MANDYVSLAISAALNGTKTFCKFLSANDTGTTGGHQAGIYVAKPAVPILFEQPCQRGQNSEKWVKIKWQNDFETVSRFIYYGQKTRNEYRITNFGRGFPFLRPEYTGALFVLVQDTEQDYQGFILNTDEEINEFLDAFGTSPTETNRLLQIETLQPEMREKHEIESFIASLKVDFPESDIMSSAARAIQEKVYDHAEFAYTDPDRKLLEWTDVEFRLFRALEYARYGKTLQKGFYSVDDFIVLANKVLNRRKSRAGKSLEHHLAAIFQINGLNFQAQAITEGHKRPDFLFPSERAYHDMGFPTDQLLSLAAKTTCKDRWRQVINEADRLRDRPKFLCTLQQGVSAAQMDEMQAEKVTLVVPQRYISSYPRDRQNKIWTVKKFVSYVREVEGI